MIDNCQDIKIFSNAAALSQLGLFLIETYKAESKYAGRGRASGVVGMAEPTGLRARG